MFGDLYYKAHADTLNRGAVNQYTGIPKNKNAFQIRRVYLEDRFGLRKTSQRVPAKCPEREAVDQ